MPGSSLRGLATPKWDLHPRLAETWLARACCIISSLKHRLEGVAASWRSWSTPHQVRWRRWGHHTHSHLRSRLRKCLRSFFLSLWSPSCSPDSFPHAVPRGCRGVPALPFSFFFFGLRLLHEPMMSHIDCLCLPYASCCEGGRDFISLAVSGPCLGLCG